MFYSVVANRRRPNLHIIRAAGGGALQLPNRTFRKRLHLGKPTGVAIYDRTPVGEAVCLPEEEVVGAVAVMVDDEPVGRRFLGRGE